MNRDDIIRMVREVGAVSEVIAMGRHSGILFTPHELEHFAALVAAAERERCVLELERNADKFLDEIIAAIRARSNQ